MNDQKTAQADEKVEALTRDVRHAIGTADDGDKQRDGILSWVQIQVCTAKLRSCFDRNAFLTVRRVPLEFLLFLL